MPLVRKGNGGPKVPPATETLSLASGSADERWAAARVAPLTSDGVLALGDALGVEQDDRVREAIFTRLVRAATPQSVEAVLPHLRSDDARLRTGALDALRAMPEAVAPRLAELLADRDSDVRLLSCEIARGLPAAAATRMLCDLLDREAVANVCGAAIEVLTEIGTSEAVPTLERCASRFGGDPFLTFAIRVALDRARSVT